VAVAASTMAAVAQVTALGKAVFDLSGRELDLGLIGLAEFLPAAALALVAGTLADRFDRRLMMAIGLGGELLCSLGLALAVGRVSGIAPLLALVVAFGSFRSLAAPAGRALPATLVAPGGLPRIIPLFSAAWQLGAVAGPVLAGFLYLVDPSLPFVASAGLLALALGAIPFIRAHPEAVVRDDSAPPPRLADALDGLRLIRRSPVLLGAISLDLFAVLFGGAVALLPALAEQRYGVGAGGLGVLRAAVGVGAAVATVVLAVRPVGRHLGRVLLGSVALFGLATIVLGVTRSFAVALLALLVGAAADAVSVFIRATLVPLITPDEYRGRVLAVENVFIGASNELGAFESGVVGQAIGASGSVVLGGVATIGVVALWASLFPALRRIDRFDDALPAAGTGHPPSARTSGPGGPATPGAPGTTGVPGGRDPSVS
jgi:MFS family permease